MDEMIELVDILVLKLAILRFIDKLSLQTR